MDTIRLLLVEDDEALAYMLKGSLELMGNYQIHTASNGVEGLSLYDEIHPDIIVSDVEMAEMSGFEMVKKIRETDAHTPIIFASARKSPKDFIEGLHIGADNFIRKPYLPEELNIQILALLRRINDQHSKDTKNAKQYSFGNYLFDAELRILQLNGSSESQLHLTEREVNILEILLTEKGNVVKRDKILVSLWGDNNFYTARSLDVFMTKIRKYLHLDSSVEIQTIRGEGFRLIVRD